MWEILSHTLAPLTKITPSKVKFKWTKIEQESFEEIERIADCDALLSYPYLNEEFNIHTSARNFQLGAFIIQNGKPIAFYIRKLTGCQFRYTVT